MNKNYRNLLFACFYMVCTAFGLSVLKAQLTAKQAIPLMMRGINIGNSLDAVPDETSWGNPLIQQSYFVAFKDAGFNCVRVPVTWDAHVSTTAPYTIDPTWLARVKQVVDWGLGQGLFVILNAHHESWLKTDPSAANIARFQSIWTQIANTFMGESDHLLFEILNEPYPMSMDNVNSINSSILSIIRQTNPTRIVIYSGDNYANTPDLEGAAIPNTNDPYLMAYYHSYDPWNFAGLAQGTWGSASDESAMKAKFDDIKNWSVTHNIPVIMDECGAVVTCDYNSRIAYYTYMVQQAVEHGIPFDAWDDNGSFQIYNRANNTWSPIKDILINTDATASYTDITSTVQAESYAQMSGVQLETTSDTGGGQDVGWIDTGDWMTYNVNVPSAGTYTIQYRVASLNGGGVLQLEQAGGAVVYGTVNVPSTGGWQNWTTITQTVTLPAGNQQLAIKANVGGWNINWWGQATTSATTFSQTIQAEDYATMSGVQTETTSDTGGGLDVGWIDATDWMSYTNSVVSIPSTGTYTVQFRVASLNGGGSLQFEEAGGATVYGSVSIPSTGGWQNWTTVNLSVNLTQGDHVFGIKALTGGWNINWFTITNQTGLKSAPVHADVANSGGVSLYPTVVSDQATVETTLSGQTQVYMFNTSGLCVMKKLMNQGQNPLDISSLGAGLYIVKVVNGTYTKTFKLIKQ